jgi:hypothetical protein
MTYLEKLAIAKWKAMAQSGKLGRRSLKRLTPLIKRHQEATFAKGGLERGTKNIIERMGLKYREPSFLDAVKSIAKDKDRIQNVQHHLYDLGTSLGKLPGYSEGGTVNLPRSVKSFRKLLGIKGPKDRASLKAIKDVFARHEVDEARLFNDMLNKGMYRYGPISKQNKAIYGGMGKLMDKLKLVRGSKSKKFRDAIDVAANTRVATTSHASPEVVLRESENIAFAPKSVRDFLTKIRGKTGETELMRRAGVEYGKVTPRRGRKKLSDKIRQIAKKDLGNSFLFG